MSAEPLPVNVVAFNVPTVETPVTLACSAVNCLPTVLLATVQGYGLSVGLESSADLVINPGAFFKITTVTTIVAGTIFLMWLGCLLYTSDAADE